MEMEQMPHWLEAKVFAAGMTAYAAEVDARSATYRPGSTGFNGLGDDSTRPASSE